MKNLFYSFLLFPVLAYGQLEIPYSVKLLNPKPLDFYFYNSSGAPYTSTAQVLAQVTTRYEGQTFFVNGVEYSFQGGIADADLLVKGFSISLIKNLSDSLKAVYTQVDSLSLFPIDHHGNLLRDFDISGGFALSFGNNGLGYLGFHANNIALTSDDWLDVNANTIALKSGSALGQSLSLKNGYGSLNMSIVQEADPANGIQQLSNFSVNGFDAVQFEVITSFTIGNPYLPILQTDGINATMHPQGDLNLKSSHVYLGGGALDITAPAFLKIMASDFQVAGSDEYFRGIQCSPDPARMVGGSLVNRDYLQGAVQEVSPLFISSITVATTGPIALSGNPVIDGVDLASQDAKVLVKNQIDPTENGVYNVSWQGAWSLGDGNIFQTSRNQGIIYIISKGASNKDTGWILQSDGLVGWPYSYLFKKVF